jgi:hypothetical protein
MSWNDSPIPPRATPHRLKLSERRLLPAWRQRRQIDASTITVASVLSQQFWPLKMS